MSFFGGGRSSAPSTPSTQTSIVREAPGIEERKIELMDIARQVADQPVNLPAIQVSPFTGLEQSALQAAGTTGVGAPTTTAGIGSLLGSQQAVASAQQAAGQGPNISQFFNPYQDFVTNEILRQGAGMQNQLAAQAVRSGAFGGGREGVQQAELQNRILDAVGRSRQAGFGTALGAAQRQQAQEIATDLSAASAGQQAAQGFGALGQQQQQMAQADINQLMGAGGVQRQLAQSVLDAQRQSTLQQQFEPYQRAEFLKNLYAAGPTTQSGVTMGTTPATSPLAQSIGTGIGAFAAYQGAKQPA
tara:strand:+ start:130 stop:1035 length:906 start_codon:yes stop_codon:yes gene_type:complete